MGVSQKVAQRKRASARAPAAIAVFAFFLAFYTLHYNKPLSLKKLSDEYLATERVSERTELLEASSFKKDVDTQKAVEAAVKASTGGDASLSVAGGDPRPKPPKQEQPGPDSSEQESHKSTIDALIESIELDYEDVVEPNDKDAADAWERERDEMAKQGEGIAAASDSTSAPTKVGAVKTPSVKKSIFPADMSFVDAIATCTTLECLRDAHLQPKGQAKFNFPHFMIIGFQKAATTSLYGYFQPHPESLNPKTKEPEFLTFDCGYRPPENCPAKRTEKYIKEVLRLDDFVASNGTRAAFEASTHIVRRGDDLAPRMLELMPWLKIMVLLREPISRAASMLVHLKDVGHEGCLMTRPLGDCLLEESQIQGAPSGARATNYTYPMQQWLEVWPLDQIHIVQYEELIEDESVAAELRRAKKFVGVNMTHVLPPLRRRNSRRFKIRPKGWPMSRSRYEELIELVRPDVDALVALLEKHGKVDKAHRWKQRWQQVWDENLASCDKKGRCNIVLS